MVDFLDQGLPLMQSLSGSLAQVVNCLIAIEFKEAGSHPTRFSSVENQATHHLGSVRLGLKPQ
jgi:hypothetical protein